MCLLLIGIEECWMVRMDNGSLLSVTSSHPRLLVSTVLFSMSLPVHFLHTHHTYCTETWQGTWEDFFMIIVVLGNMERGFCF